VKGWSYHGAHMLDAYRLWQVMSGRTLGDAVREFLNREPTEAHSASGDNGDTLEVLKAMFERWPNLPRSMRELHAMCFKNDDRRIDEDGKFVWVQEIIDGTVTYVPTCGFGKKWNGFPMKDVHRSYYEWIVNSEFGPDTKRVARDAMNGVFPTRS
jgi:DNA polymerase-3 subunit epsilon